MHLRILGFQFTSQMALLSIIFLFYKTKLCLTVPGRQEKYIFYAKSNKQGHGV